MKKLMVVLTISALFAIGLSSNARAACTGAANHICIRLQDSLGNLILGDPNTLVTIIAEGVDGNMLGLPNPSWNSVADGSGMDLSPAGDGFVEVDATGQIDPGNNTPDYTYEVASTSGFVNLGTTSVTVSGSGDYNQTASLNYVIKVTVQDELGGSVSGASLTIANAGSGSCNAIFTDGSIGAVGDMNGADGVIYIKCPVGAFLDAIDMTVFKAGYVSVVNNGFSISNGAQVSWTTSNQFTLKIAAGGIQDELGNTITPADANPATIFSGNSGTTVVNQRTTGGIAYIAASGAGNLRIQYPGYIQKDIAVVPSSALQNNAGPYTYTAGNSLPFQIVLNYANVEDEIPNALPYAAGDTFIVCTNGADWTACNASKVATVSAQNNGATWYLAPYAAPAAYFVGIQKDGYVRTVSAAAITTAYAGPAVSPSFNTVASRLKFGLKVSGIVDELGNPLPGGPDSVTFGGAADQVVAGVYYWANTTAVGGTLSITEAGFFSAEKGNPGFNAAITLNNTGQTSIVLDGATGLAAVVTAAANSALGLRYSVKTTVKDEIDNAIISTAVVGSGTGYLIPCAENGVTGVYYCAVPDGQSSNVQSVKDGYVTTTKAGANVDLIAGSQIVNDLTGANGMPFSHRITVQREGDNAALTGATVTAGSANTPCIAKPATPGDYLCPVLLANDNSANDVKVTLDGYVYNNLVTSANRILNGDAQSNDLVTGGNSVLFGYKIISIITDGNVNITATATGVKAGDGQATTCVLSAGAWYCPVPVAHTTLGIQVTFDGYVLDATSLVFNTDRTAQADGQQTATTGTVKTAFKITAITTDGNVAIINTGETVSAGNGQATVCALNAGEWYCPVPVADTTLGIQVTKDGYVADATSFVFSSDRTSATDGQISATTGSVKTAFKIASIMSDGNVDITLTATGVVTGDAQGTTCVLNAGAWYCPMPVANTTLAIQVTLDGYVQDITSLSFNTDRTANADAQVSATTGSVKTAFKITSIMTDGNIDITATATGVKTGNAQGTTCVLYSGAWYCPVPVADVTLAIQVTKDGYVQDIVSLAFTGDRAAQTSAQETATNGGTVKTAYRITSIPTDSGLDIVAAATGVKAGNAQGTTCVANGGAWYCPVPVADTTLGIQTTLDGYVQDATSLVFNTDRTAVTDGQQSLTTGSVKTAFKITAITTDGNVAIINTGETVSAGNGQATVCALNAGEWYCPVPVGDTTLGIQVTKDGYVADATSFVFSSDRTSATDGQISATTGAVKTAFKIASIMSDGNVDITLTATGVVTGDAQGTTCVLNAGAWYCPMPVANTTLAIRVTLDGYVQDITSLSFNTDRTANADAQVSATTGSVKTAFKITSIMTDGNIDITTTATGVQAGNAQGTTCVLYSGAWYCPVPVADVTLAIQVTKDGYVQDIVSLAFTGDRAAQNSAQETATNGGTVKTAYRITSIPTDSGVDIVATATGVKAGNAQGTTCVANGGAWYCPVPVADTTLGIQATLDGYVQDATSLVFNTDRTAVTDGQQSLTTGSVKTAFMITAITTDGNVAIINTGESVRAGNAQATVCVSNGGVWYCPVPVADTTLGIQVTKDGYVADATSFLFSSDRASATDGQISATIGAVKTAFKITSIMSDGNVNITLTATGVMTGDLQGTTCALNAGAWYCPMPVADTTLAIQVTLDGYVQDTTSLAFTTDRTANTDPQLSTTNGGLIKTAYKITSIMTDGNIDITSTATGVKAGNAQGTTCVLYSGAWYCPVPVADATLAIQVTKDGYVQDIVSLAFTGDRALQTSAQETATNGGTVKTAYRITSIPTDSGVDIVATATSVKAGDAQATTCVSNAGAWYCPVPVADTTLGIQATLDGYVQDATALVFNTDRTAVTDGQQSLTTGSVKTAFKITVITTDGNVAIINTGESVSAGNAQATVCVSNGGVWYCPVPVADTTLGIQVTKDGYVADATSFLFSSDRTAATDGQISATTGAVKTAFKITSIMSDGNVDITLTATGVVTGDAQGTTCTLNAGAWYCPMPVANTTLAIQVTKDGYVQDITSLSFNTDRVANADAQVSATTGTVKTAYKITSIMTDGNVDITLTATEVKTGDAQGTTCALYSGAWYCPVPVADTTLAIQVTKDGYVQDIVSLAFTGDRAAQTSAQETATNGGTVKTAYRITSIPTDSGVDIVATATGVKAGDAQGTTCVSNAGAWYCPVPVADTTLGIQATLDGYVQDATSLVFNTDRTAATDGQQSLTTGSVKTAFKITAITTDGNVAIINTGETVSAGNAQATVCVLNGGEWYCPVPVADTTLGIQVTKDGYVADATSFLFSSDRTAATDGQISATTGAVKTAFKITSIMSDGNVNITLTATGVVTGDAQGTTCALNAGAWYCPMPVANTTLAIQVTLDGYVQDITSLSFNTDRVANTDAQVSATTGTVKTAYKISSIVSDGNVDITTTATGVKTGDAQGTTCLLYSGAWYCPVPVADTTLAIQVTKDGYVQDITSLAFTGDRAAQTSAQETATAGAVKTAYMIASIMTDGNVDITATATGVKTGNAQGTVCVSNAGAWYCPAPLADTTLAIQVTLDGYVQDVTSLAFNTDRTAVTDGQQSAKTGAVKTAYKITSIPDELTPATELINTGETVSAGDAHATVCVFNVNAWYCPVPVASANLGVYVANNGYISDQTSLVFTSDRAAQTDSQVAATTGGIKYAFKISADDELGSAVTLTDLNSALTGANLTVISTKSMSGLLYVAGTTTGVGDFTLSRTGFVNSTTTAGTYQYVNTAQQAIAYTGALALKYGLKVTVYDETGRPASYCTATHNNLPPKFADQGPNNNIYYFDTVGAANLKIIKAGFQTIGIIPTTNLVTPGGGAVAQTVIELTGRTSGDIGTVLGGQTKIANGIKFATNVLVKVAHEGDPTGLTGLGNLTNFFFEDAVGSRVTPTMFIEVDPSNQPGAYQFKVPTTAAVLKIKDVDFDSDPYVDFDESAPVNLVGLTDTTLTDYGTSTLNFAVDHIALSANSQFAAGANDVVTITLFNNDGATMTTGIHANTEVEVELAGGSVTPPTQKDYSGASLTANSFRTSGGSKFIKGGLTAGSATVTVTDNVITGDTNKLLLSVAGTSGIWPQKAASNTVDLPIKVVTAAPSKIIVINPSDLSTDATATVVLQVQDARGNVVATDTIFRVTVSGSARITGSTPAGQIILQSAVNDVRVMAANGIVTLSVKDSVAETVDINVFDDVMFYGLNDDSTQNVVFSPGAPVSVVFVTPAPTTQTVTQAITVGVQIRDAGGNVVTTSSEAFTVKALGSPTPSLSTAMFTSITAPATIVSGVNTNTVAVRAANGVVSLSLTDNTAETVILSIEGTTLNASSQTSVSFTSGAVNKLVIKYNPADLTLIAGGAPTGYIVQVQDAQGNPITLAADLTVNLTTSQTTTGKFYATSAGTTPVTSITVATGANSNYFYYRDTKATTSLTGQTHLTTSGTGVFSDGIDINVNPATPVTGYTVVTASSTEPEQPTGVKNRQTVSINDSDGLRTLVLVDYPYTSAASQIDRIVADGFTRGIIRIEAKDKYGNAISGKQVSFITTMGGVTKSGLINPAADMTDTDGKARFEITSTEIGDVIVTVRITDGSVITYGEMFTVRFKPDDRTPPEITRYSSDKTAILDGDYIAAAGPIRIHVSITDPGLNPSGVDLSSIQVSVKNTATNQTYSGTTPSLTGCVVESNCLIEWNPPTSLPAGPYEVSLSVSDRNANIQTKKWSVAVEGGTVLRNVMAGPGVFDPRNGGSMQIGFQSPQDGAIVRLEIFDRSGQIINTQIMTAQAGYNAFDWNGRESSGDIPGNGIYVFRITASIGGQSVSQKGKFAIFKR